MGDRFEAVQRIADAVLYEGYLLYPYRALVGEEPGPLPVRGRGAAGAQPRWTRRRRGNSRPSS